MTNVTRPSLVPIRTIIWIMMFTCTFVLYLIRTNISIILLAMVKAKTTNSSAVIIPECIIRNMNVSANDAMTVFVQKQQSHITHGTTYEWDSTLQGLILAAYFWGFVISGIPGAAIAEKYGPRKCVAISFTFSAVLTLVGPVSAEIHPNLLIASRFFIGLLAGIVYPAIHSLISKWAPPSEKGKFISSTLGGSLGTVITWPLLGNVIEHISWDWAFYISGIIVLVWTVVWIIFVHDSPEEHPWISLKEKEYIVSSLAGTISAKKRIPPYKSIVLSVPAWALCVAQFGNLWGLFFLMTAGPKYLSTVLGFDLGNTGFLAALPYLARMIAGFVFGSVGDFIQRRGIMEKTTIRRSFTLFSHFIPGIFLIIQTFVGCHVHWAILFITLSLASNGASTLTNLSNAQDLAPNFAGSLYGIANCIGSTTGFISPMIVGYLTAQHNGIDEWHTIFYLGAAVYIACGIFFVCFGTADIQSWNYSDDDTDKDVETIKGSSDDAAKGVENIGFDSSSELENRDAKKL